MCLGLGERGSIPQIIYILLLEDLGKHKFSRQVSTQYLQVTPVLLFIERSSYRAFLNTTRFVSAFKHFYFKIRKNDNKVNTAVFILLNSVSGNGALRPT